MENQVRVETKAADEIFCTSCGRAIKKEAQLCVHCGVLNAVRPVAVQQTQYGPKQKSTAVLLAVFLGGWAWLYTYRKDAWKFWVNFGLCLITLGLWGFVTWFWAVIDVCVKPEEYYLNFNNQV